MPSPDSVSDPSAGAPGNVHDLAVESGIQRVRRMQHEMHSLAEEQVMILAQDLSTMSTRLGEIAEGGDAYPVGVRELSSRMADELASAAQSLQAIMGRAPKV